MHQPLDRLSARRRVLAMIEPWRGTPGVTVGVVENAGEGRALVLHESAGLASVELGVPIGPETCFRIASVSKQFTCAAILLLAAEGRLGVGDRVRDHLPGLPECMAEVTLDHLMHNSSGVRDMLEIMRQGGVDLGTACTTEELLEGIARQRTLNFPVGSRFLYSNAGFLLLGRVVEAVSGERLADVLQRRVFAPMGMTRTRHAPEPYAPVPGLATGYLADGAGFRKAAHGFPIGGEGGLVSCVEDLALWDRAHADGHVGGVAIMAGLQEPAAFTNGRPSLYLRGLRADTYRGVATVSHGGLWPGFRTEFLRAPALGCTVIVIANNGAIDPAALAHQVLDVWAEGRPGFMPVPPMPSLDGLSGRWLDAENTTTLEIARDGEGLAVTAGGATVHLIAGADGRLVNTHGTVLLALRRQGEDALEVEADAGHLGVFRRLATPTTLPADLAGRYVSEEMAAEWVFSATDSGTVVRVDGPKLRGTVWPVEAVEGDVFRVWVPGTLARQWYDVRATRDASGQVSGLLVNSNRLKGVSYQRVA